MIIEIIVPVMGKQYDFRIDDNIPLYEVKRETVEMICQKEQCVLEGDLRGLLLWNLKSHVRLKEEKTALENGLKTGSRVLLA